MNIELLWSRYSRRPNQRLRNQIVEHYVGLVDNVASSVASKLPRSVERDDLISAGYVGLMDAVAKFEPERGIKFETYATNRIRGQMLDELRSTDWVPRSVRTRNKIVEQTATELQEQLGRAPTDYEVADALNVSVDKVRRDKDKAMAGRMMPLDQTVNHEESLTLVDVVSEERDDESHLDNLFSSTVEAVEAQNGREGIVITLYYYEGLTLAEIGRVLGVTESRVCQIHTKAIQELGIST